MLLERLSSFGIVDFIILAFATYRVAVMLTHNWEVGPGEILTKLRARAGWVYPAHGEPYAEDGSLAQGLICYFCNSVWIGIIFTLAYASLLAVGLPAWLFFMPLAASGAAVLIAEATEGEKS